MNLEKGKVIRVKIYKLKRLLTAVIAIIMVCSLAVSAFAEDPYSAYGYDAWSNAVPSQSGYIAKDIVTGTEMGLEQLSNPESPFFISETESAALNGARDMFVSSKNEFYIVDTLNNRIIKTDINFNMLACYKVFVGGTKTASVTDENGNAVDAPLTTLNGPYGIFVDEDDIMYIADTDNERVIKCRQPENPVGECEIIHEYVRPETELYSSVSFRCTKVLVDAAKNVFVICPAVNKGAVMFSPSGNFVGFFGANRVEVDAEVLRNRLWRKFATEEQAATLVSTTPVEYANFDIDEDGFIYTVTEVANASTDAVKKLNPAGKNILLTTTDAAKFGDQQTITYSGNTYATRLTDIAIGENGIINILDYSTGRIFQYDRECNLLFIFGCDQEGQKGGFNNPNAVESLGNSIYILDGLNNDITVFEETLFGKYVHEAAEMFNKGLYEESLDLWREVSKRDGNYQMAYTAIGRALLNKGEYKESLKYFKLAFEKDDYDRAFEAWRQEIIRDNFTLIVVGLLLLVAIYLVIKALQKKGKIPKHLIKTGLGWVAAKIKNLVLGIIEKIKKGGKK